jgi:putative acetyltransferase
MSETVAIREARDADGPALSALIARIFAEYDGCLFVAEEFPELAAPASHYAAKGGRLWVAETRVGEGHRLVGSVAVTKTWLPEVFELFKVYVAADQRGTGLAARLLGTASDFAGSQGATSLTLWSDSRFVAGHRFYAKHGFRRLPGLRALHDVSRTLEFGFRRDETATKVPPSP